MNVEGGVGFTLKFKIYYLIFKLMEDSFRFDEIQQIVALLFTICM